MTVYTSGDWLVKAGCEEAFAEKWRELAGATAAEIEPGARQVLLRDLENPRHFRSFGKWQDNDEIVQWRDGTVFGRRIGELYELLESAAPAVFEVAAAVDQSKSE